MAAIEPRPPGDQASGCRVRSVAEPLGHLEDATPGLGVQPTLAVQRVRHGRHRDAGLPRHVPDAHAPSHARMLRPNGCRAPGPIIDALASRRATATWLPSERACRDRSISRPRRRAVRRPDGRTVRSPSGRVGGVGE